MFKKRILTGNAKGHLPICFAITSFLLGIPIERYRALFLFIHTKNIVSAAIRLNLIGPYGGQTILYHAKYEVEKIIARVDSIQNAPFDDCGSKLQLKWDLEDDIHPVSSQSAPLLDILQGSHDALYSRLFNS
jgi:urease accessory protein